MFDLRRLRLLHEFALRGTLTAVANALSFTPSAVSQQLSILEREAGVPLLEADGRRVRLTAHGKTLAAHATRALEQDERARAELAAVRGGWSSVRIAVMQSVAEAVVPVALTHLESSVPDLRVEVCDLPPEQGLFELRARTVDVVIAEQYPEHARTHVAGIARRHIAWDPVRVAVPGGSRATSLDELSDRAWVLEPVGTAARAWALQQCRAVGFEPDVRYDVSDLVAHFRLVQAGHAVALLPDLMWADHIAPGRLLSLPGEPRREIFAACRESSHSDRSVETVIEAVQHAWDVVAAHASQSLGTRRA